jgi:hypothetical protein
MSANTAPRVIFLESQEGVESLFTRGLRSGAVAAGCDVEVVFLADAAGHPRSEKQVRIDLLVKQPDTVCFLMDAPLDLKFLWDVPSLAAIDKISLWFDDYCRSPKTLAHPGVWTEWQKKHGVRVGIWDGYWRYQWKRLTGVEAFPVHLAADPKLLRPHAESWNRAWNERAAFIGTVPSLRSLDVCAQAFPAPLRRFLDEVCSAMQREAWPIRAYDVAKKMPLVHRREIWPRDRRHAESPDLAVGQTHRSPARPERSGPGRSARHHERAWHRILRR